MVSPRGRSGGDGGAGRIPLHTVLGVFHQRDDKAKPLTAGDIMETVDCSRRSAHNKLNSLVEEGVLKTRKVGSRSRVWWVPIEDTTDAASETDLSIETIAERTDLPGTGKTLEARHEALIAAYEYLKEYPEAKKSDFLQDVFPENPAGYETAEGWWNAIQPALAELPGVNPPEERGHIWHFLGG